MSVTPMVDATRMEDFFFIHAVRAVTPMPDINSAFLSMGRPPVEGWALRISAEYAGLNLPVDCIFRAPAMRVSDKRTEWKPRPVFHQNTLVFAGVSTHPDDCNLTLLCVLRQAHSFRLSERQRKELNAENSVVTQELLPCQISDFIIRHGRDSANIFDRFVMESAPILSMALKRDEAEVLSDGSWTWSMKCPLPFVLKNHICLALRLKGCNISA